MKKIKKIKEVIQEKEDRFIVSFQTTITHCEMNTNDKNSNLKLSLKYLEKPIVCNLKNANKITIGSDVAIFILQKKKT